MCVQQYYIDDSERTYYIIGVVNIQMHNSDNLRTTALGLTIDDSERAYHIIGVVTTKMNNLNMCVQQR